MKPPAKPSTWVATRAFAAGDRSRRAEAIAEFHAYLKEHADGSGNWQTQGPPEARFMAEVDSPIPDLLLRARYRWEVLDRV